MTEKTTDMFDFNDTPSKDYLFTSDDVQEAQPSVQKVDVESLPTLTTESLYADMDNSLLRGYYSLSGLAQKMFIKELAVSKNAALGKQSLGDKWYNGSKFFITDFLKDWNLTDGGQQRKNIIKATHELSQFQIGLKIKNKDTDSQSILFINMYQAVKLSPEENSIVTYYSEPFVDILKRFHAGYTRISIEQAVKIKKDKYGFNLHWYTFLNSYRHLQGKGTNEMNRFYLKLTFDELKKIFLGSKKEAKIDYSSDVAFRRGLIENPLRDINEAKVDLRVSWEYLKTNEGSSRKFSAVKLLVEIIDSWDFRDIGFVFKVFGNAPVSPESKKMILDNKERYLDLARIKSKYRTPKIDFSDLETEEKLQAARTFFLEVASELKGSLEDDEFFKASYIRRQ